MHASWQRYRVHCMRKVFANAGKQAVQRARYMTLETIAPLSDDPIVSLPAVTA